MHVLGQQGVKKNWKLQTEFLALPTQSPHPVLTFVDNRYNQKNTFNTEQLETGQKNQSPTTSLLWLLAPESQIKLLV